MSFGGRTVFVLVEHSEGEGKLSCLALLVSRSEIFIKG